MMLLRTLALCVGALLVLVSAAPRAATPPIQSANRDVRFETRDVVIDRAARSRWPRTTRHTRGRRRRAASHGCTSP